MLKRYYDLESNEVFHFQNSLRPFIRVMGAYSGVLSEDIVIDIEEGMAYDVEDEDLEREGLRFFYNEDDESN